MLAHSGNRHVLFLQGTGSYFFWRLAKRFQQTGVRTSRIQFCLSDYLFWPSTETDRFSGSMADWESFLTHYLSANSVSDIVLFSDSRPYHKVATRIARGLGLNVFVFENGYLRPSWITMERNGVNGRSPFPSTRKGVKALAAKYKQNHFKSRALEPKSGFRLHLGDVAYHAINYLGTVFHWRYKNFRQSKPLQELWGWTKKAIHRPIKLLRSRSQVRALLDSKKRFFFFPLQVENDYQLLVDSPFDNLEAACEHVIASFANCAPKDVMLFVKNHPLDNNYINREKQISRLAKKHGVADHVFFAETAHNPTILAAATGMVTVNSTMGTSALHHGLPLCVLGSAVYDIKGLTHKGGLDTFWSNPTKPNKKFYKTFKRALIGSSQISGRFSTQDIEDDVYNACVAKVLAVDFKPAGLSTARRVDHNQEISDQNVPDETGAIPAS